MSNVQQHIGQYRKNKGLLSESLFLINDECRYLDWVTTIIFYTALHLVHSHLASEPLYAMEQLRDTHGKLNNLVSTLSKFKHISAEYNLLYMESRKARYGCIPFRARKVQQLYDKLQLIEQTVPVPQLSA
ncbi:hypothetical protein [Desulfosporosinus fructosivorans]